MPRRPLKQPDEYAAHFDAVVLRVAQLEAAGLSRRTIARWCAPGGPWTRLLPGVVLTTNRPVNRGDARRAALVIGGPGAVITGADALDLHGLRHLPVPHGPVHVLIPQQRRRVGGSRVLAERTERLPAPAPGRWPVAPVARAVLDFCRRTSDRALTRAVLAEAVQRGLCTPLELSEELEAGCSRGSALPRSVLQEISAGVRSVAEAEARSLVRRSELPEPLWNVSLYDRSGRFIASPDGWFDEVGLAWEIDSHEFHLSPADHDRTLDRRARMTAEKIVVLHTQPSKLRRPAAALADLRGAYELAAQRPRPAVVVVRAGEEHRAYTGGR